jgi:glycerol kinase
MLLNIHDQSSDQAWDETLLDLFGVDESLLPEVRPSAGAFGVTDAAVLGAEIPIMGVAGDQHAALFGLACFRPGMAKCTYGTGAFILQNTGPRAVQSDQGLLTTPAWQLGGRRTFALEGSIFTTGATVQWLRDGLAVIADASETGPLAESIPDNEGVYMVPAFAGLGAPYWDPDARAAILGLTRGSGAAHMARAALESTAYQVRDVLEVMSRDSNKRPEGALRVDGGQTVNGFLMQFQADILDRPIDVAPIPETTALGAALLAGLTQGIWGDVTELESNWVPAVSYEPRMTASERDRLYSEWRDAVRRTQTIRSD